MTIEQEVKPTHKNSIWLKSTVTINVKHFNEKIMQAWVNCVNGLAEETDSNSLIEEMEHCQSKEKIFQPNDKVKGKHTFHPEQFCLESLINMHYSKDKKKTGI